MRNKHIGVMVMMIVAILVSFHAELASATGRGDQPEQDSAIYLPVVTRSLVTRTIDDLFSDVAAQVPAFGGMFINKDGQLSAYLTDTTQAEAAETAIRRVFASTDLPENKLQVLQGKYGFADLRRWYKNKVATTLVIPGVILTDIDEMHNRLSIEVKDESSAAAVRDALGKIDIPPDAVSVRVTEPLDIQDAPPTNNDKVRPLLGGLAISTTVGGCTLGFTAAINGIAGFTTNSHCTDIQGGVEGTRVFQVALPDQVGTELLDPPYVVMANCPFGRRCRFSDSAFIGRDAGPDQAIPPSAADFGYIASVNADKTITDRYRVETNVAFPIAGTVLTKVGRTSGETSGILYQTCVDDNQTSQGQDTGLTVLCQYVVAAPSLPGDSGSPVFLTKAFVIEGDPRGVGLYGILWGGSLFRFAFSPMVGLYNDLGSFRTYPNDPLGGNSAPEARIMSPVAGINIDYGGFNAIQLKAAVADYEDGSQCCTNLTWSTDVDGTIGHVGTTEYTFDSPGIRHLNLEARDSNGAAGQANGVTINVVNSPPQAKIVFPRVSQVIFKGVEYVFSGSGSDANELELACSALVWTSSSLADSLLDSFPATGCHPTIKFAGSGSRTITLTATDENGATDKATVEVNVLEPLPTAPPIVTILSPFEGEFVDANQTLTVSGTAVDPANKTPLEFKWALDDGTVLATQSGGANNKTTFEWKPADDLLPNCGGRNVIIHLYATNTAGARGQASSTFYVYFPVC